VRRLVAPLLSVGAVLLVAALVWPTDRLVVASPAGVAPLLDIWLWGRVRSLSELSSTDVAGSTAVLGMLVVAVAVVVAAAMVWLSAVRRDTGGRVPRRRAVPAAAAVAAGVGLAVLALNVDPPGFGWFAPGAVSPTFVRTTVAVFPTVALGLWLAALVVMVAVLARRPEGPDEAPEEPAPA